MPVIEINPDFKKALDLMETTNEHIFITGKAGTGKSTLLRYFLDHTEKEVTIIAPTGVAALLVGGQTIHSFFRFSTHVTEKEVKRKKIYGDQRELFKNLTTIVIDEVSMVRADLMDCIDQALQKARGSKQPFGGVQMIFVGDLYQLPPVVSTGEERKMFSSIYSSPYFFSAKVFETLLLKFIELEKIYRQKDERFIELLNKIRNNSIQPNDIEALNRRAEKPLSEVSQNGYAVTLTTTNARAGQINDGHLENIGRSRKTYIAQLSGDFESSHFPTAKELSVKEGAQIMMLNNDGANRWVNGSMGKIVKIRAGEDDEDELLVRLSDGRRVTVTPHTWEMRRYIFQSGHLDQELIGSFTQYPLRLAWAVTIHKSQGKTFDQVIIDLGKGTFAHGQTYVALSRCTSFEGLSLRTRLEKKHVLMDYRVVKFLTGFQYQQSEKALSLAEKSRMIAGAIADGKRLSITYLKPDDTKSRREIIPQKIGDMSYAGKTFFGLEAFCLKRQDMRVFRVDRILEMSIF